MSISYNGGNDPTNPSSIGPQLVDYKVIRPALTEPSKERKFSPLVGTKIMPKFHGKTMKLDHYIPILDDRNVNDEGIDASGKSLAKSVTITIIDKNCVTKSLMGFGDTDALALTDAGKRVTEWARIYIGTGVGTDYATTKATLEANGWEVKEGKAVPGSGAFYGSSKDIGVMEGKMPLLGEHGGRVNRVGVTRITHEGTLQNFGFFHEITEDSLQFDSDPQLFKHITREALEAAYQIQEDRLQIDLLNNYGVCLLGGDAVAVDQLDKDSVLTFSMLDKCKQILNENNCPTNTKLVTGSTNTDTRTINSARYIYVGSELSATLQTMTNPFKKEAFVEVFKYADATNVVPGEIGSVGSFRFVEAQEMAHWAGVGAAVADGGEDTHYSTDGKYDVFPCLVVGSGSFYTINLGQVSKSGLRVIVKKPGYSTADKTDPYGKTGFWSCEWWYGFLCLRPEHIAVMKVTAPISV